MAVRAHFPGRRSSCFLLAVLGLSVAFAVASAHGHAGGSGSCPFASDDHDHHHHHHHGDHHHHHHHTDDGSDHHHGCGHGHGESALQQKRKLLPEELAEEEDLKLEMAHGHGHHHHHFHGVLNEDLSALGLWLSAMGCSLLVSMASLVCLILLPVFFLRGKPSKLVVDSLATFGAGAMLGDAFLHQLPHAFGGGHSHSHDHHEAAHSHSHSLQDLSVGLSVLSGIVLFLLVEKLVRYVEEVSGKSHEGRGHHHHHSKIKKKLKNDCIDGSNPKSEISFSKETETSGFTNGSSSDKKYDSVKADKETEKVGLHKRGPTDGAAGDLKEFDGAHHSPEKIVASAEASMPPSSSLVFGYLNLFSDGVHNFTDGMALGSAFLLYGSVGGWSRTLFLLAHELPQEVGDFGILVRSGFTVSKALLFNFLSALVALFGTALALIIGKDPGQSSLIEGFTAGGFIYIAVAGVLPELNNEKTTFRSTALQLASLLLGIGVALCISLVE